MESHGGYLCRLESVDASQLVRLARRALVLDGIPNPSDASLLVSVIPERKVLRLGYDSPFTYGRRGALWYENHHQLARIASRELGTVVHAYVYDADEMEFVSSYGNGARVGGERLYVEDVELPDNDDELDDDGFEKLKVNWPLGHLAKVYGVSRDELVRMPLYATSVLLDLASPGPKDIEALEALILTAPRRARVG